MSSIIKESLKLLRASIPSNIQIHQHFSNEFDVVQADLSQIHQMLMSLYTNAVHSMRQDGGILDVSLVDLELSEKDELQDYNLNPGQYLILSVLDTGQGIEPDVIDLIFNPFFTTKGFEEHTGMGLSVVRSIVQNHGGTITVQSDKDAGAIFHVILPVVKEIKSAGASLQDSMLTGDESILLVEDDRGVLTMEKKMMESLGYKVQACIDPNDALARFKQAPDAYDLVVTDQMMPGMTGAALSKKMLRIRSDIPVIVCTGFSETFTEDKARSIGIRAYILKPVDKREMARAIRKVLDEGRSPLKRGTVKK